jgi:hypothetical protein
MALFETNKRRREAKEFKATVAKGKKDYKAKKSSATTVSGTMKGKQVDTTKSMFTASDVGKPKTLKGSPHPKYNEDMSNRVTVNKPVGPDYKPKPASDPSYNKAVQSPKAGDMKEGKKKMTGDTSLAKSATKSAQGLLDRSKRYRKGY